MRFAVYVWPSKYVGFNNHKTDTQNKSGEETVIIWFTLKSGLELTGFRTARLSFQQVSQT